MNKVARCYAVLVCSMFVLPSTVWAATGSIKFQEVSVKLNSGGGARPVAPEITVDNVTGEWRANATPFKISLDVTVDMNSGTHPVWIRVGVPTFDFPGLSRPVFSVPFRMSRQKVNIRDIDFQAPGSSLGIMSIGAAQVCALQHANGRSGTYTLPLRIDVGVEVRAERGSVFVERARRNFARHVEGQVRCVTTSPSAGVPQRTTGAPKRTPGAPKRTLPPYKPVSAELAFVRFGPAVGCPATFRQVIRVTAAGPGQAKVYVVKNDGQGTMGAPIFINVDAPQGSRYVGVQQRNLVIDRNFRQSYRAVVANQNGPAVYSPWVLLDVAC